MIDTLSSSSSSSVSVSQLRNDDDQQQDQCNNDTDSYSSSSTHSSMIRHNNKSNKKNKEVEDDQYNNRNMVVQHGDIVTLTNVQLVPEHDFIPEQPILFCNTDNDDSDHSYPTSLSSLYHTSSLTFIVGWGNYIPGLHDILLHHHPNCSINDTIQNISIDAGYGEHQSNLIFHIPISKLLSIIIQQQQLPSSSSRTDYHSSSSLSSSMIQIGMTIRLKGGIDVVVTDIIPKNDDDSETMIVVDANPPLAGSSYSCSFTVSSIQRYNFDNIDIATFHENYDDTATNQPQQQYQMATFALGCFWGAELAFMRVHGVVGTRVGYTQGITLNPTYHDVCQGYTQHRESVQVVYDTTIVSYEQLMDVALQRLQSVHGISSIVPHHDVSKLFHNSTATTKNDDGHKDDMDEMKQYRHGFYYHTKQQRDMAMDRLFPSTTSTMNDDDDDNDIQKQQQSCPPGVRYEIEIQKATKFWIAELYHQQYLYKGGQSARKGSTIPIRCYG